MGQKIKDFTLTSNDGEVILKHKEKIIAVGCQEIIQLQLRLNMDAPPEELEGIDCTQLKNKLNSEMMRSEFCSDTSEDELDY